MLREQERDKNRRDVAEPRVWKNKLKDHGGKEGKLKLERRV